MREDLNLVYPEPSGGRRLQLEKQVKIVEWFEGGDANNVCTVKGRRGESRLGSSRRIEIAAREGWGRRLRDIVGKNHHFGFTEGGQKSRKQEVHSLICPGWQHAAQATNKC